MSSSKDLQNHRATAIVVATHAHALPVDQVGYMVPHK